MDGGTSGITTSSAIDSLNSQLTAYGVTASITSSGTLQFQSANAGMGVTTLAAGDLAGAAAGTPSVLGATNTANALTAVGLIDKAITTLGSAQGVVGAGETT